MFNKLIKLYEANKELNKHKRAIDKYNEQWAKIRKENAKKDRELRQS